MSEQRHTPAPFGASTGSADLDSAIGSLLDEWDRVPTDLKWGTDLVRLRSKVEALERAVCRRLPQNATGSGDRRERRPVTTPSATAGSQQQLVRPGSRVARALAFIDHVRMASHIEIANHLGIAPWRASAVCTYLHRRGLISLEHRGKRGPVSHPTVWHTKTNI